MKFSALRLLARARSAASLGDAASPFRARWRFSALMARRKPARTKKNSTAPDPEGKRVFFMKKISR